MIKRFYEWYQRFYYFWNYHKKTEINVHLLVADIWPIDPCITIDCIQKTIQGPGFYTSLNDLWSQDHFSESLTEYLHSFQWLRSLRQYGDTQARLIGRESLLKWCEKSKKFSSLTWGVDVLGRRLASWLKLYEFFTASASEQFRVKINSSIAQQSRYLESCFILEESPIKRLLSLKGLILSQVAIKEFEKKLRFSLQWLSNELNMQILEDGTHYSRCPSTQVTILKDLLDIRSILKTHKDDSFLQYYIEKMVPIVRLLRHGDGAIAYFNQGHYCKSDLLDVVLSYADMHGKPPSRGIVSGFERLQSEKTLILADMGQYTASFKPEKSQISGPTYSFELSIGKQRILTNLSAERFISSALNFDNNTAAVLKDLGDPHTHTDIERLEQDGHKFISGTRSWHFKEWSCTHNRQIFLDKSGNDIRGQDAFSLHAQSTDFIPEQPFKIFFHFHPTIHIQETTNPAMILLKIPTLGQWYFHWYGHIEIEKIESQHFLEKIYKGCTLMLKGVIPCSKITQKTTQHIVKWALKSE